MKTSPKPISIRHEKKPRLQLSSFDGPHVLTAQDLNELVVELASRPGHEKVRVLLHRLLVDGLGADSRDIYFERPVPEVCGRIDALLGRTVFELKSDLRRERKDAEKGLTRYLSEREGQTGEKYVGITTDGADFIAFFLKNGSVVEVGAHRTHLEKPPARAPISGRDSLTVWLQGVVAIGDSLPPTPHAIKREFGRDSLAAKRALDDLGELWFRIGQTPEVRLKRELWGQASWSRLWDRGRRRRLCFCNIPISSSSQRRWRGRR